MSKTYHINETPPMSVLLPLSMQHILCMFGATILVPILLKADPGVCLLMNGIGTLIYLSFCRWQIPAYLGSSFAFISPALAVIGSSSFGFSAAQGGFIVFGAIFVLLGLVVKQFGHAWIQTVLPDAAMGALVSVIGLELAPVAGQMAGFSSESVDIGSILVATVTFVVTLSVAGGNFRRISAFPVIIGVCAGTLLAFANGLIDFTPMYDSPWFAVPNFSSPTFEWQSIMMILPATLVVFAEHVGHLIVTGEVCGKNLIEEPGLHRSLVADGVSNILSGFAGATPNTTYGENIGVMSITRVYSTSVLGVAAAIAIVLSFCGKFAALIRLIPTPVMGGVCLLLFGVIAAAGVRMLVDRKVDFSKGSNLCLTAGVLIVGTSGIKFSIGGIEWKGMALSALFAVLCSLWFKTLSIIQK